jgi:hypothetical protein
VFIELSFSMVLLVPVAECKDNTLTVSYAASFRILPNPSFTKSFCYLMLIIHLKRKFRLIIHDHFPVHLN